MNIVHNDTEGLMVVVYSVLAAAGLFGTWLFNIRSGAAGEEYLPSWFATNASSSAAVDLLVVAAAASIFMIVEGRRIGLRWVWVLVILSFVIALAFTFPLFLALRHRHLARRSAVAGSGGGAALGVTT